MRVVLQRVSRASVSVNKEIISKIGYGYVLLVGIGKEDTEAVVKDMAETVVHLRVMSDESGKMNKSILEVKGEILVVSQFTLYADTSKGRRPFFGNAASPKRARDLLGIFVTRLLEFGLVVREGEFGADMEVALVNDGPMTIILE